MDITEYCQECRNYFAPVKKKSDRSYIHAGEFTISNKAIAPLDFILTGQYFRIVGSSMNDGVYCNTAEGLANLTDETFHGYIWEMSVPRAFIDLCSDISAWRATNEAADSNNMSPYSAESFAGYSYQKGTSNQKNSGQAISWKMQFSSRLDSWRRLNIL